MRPAADANIRQWFFMEGQLKTRQLFDQETKNSLLRREQTERTTPDRAFCATCAHNPPDLKSGAPAQVTRRTLFIASLALFGFWNFGVSMARPP